MNNPRKKRERDRQRARRLAEESGWYRVYADGKLRLFYEFHF